MTNEQINAAIAEACGRRRNPKGGWYPDNGWDFGTQGIPDYCNDLNSMHEAEKVLTGLNRHAFCDGLFDIVADHLWEVLTATARLRAEAFLRTLGKWEEVQG